MQENLWYPIHMQQGVSIMWQLITGKERYIPAADRLQTLEQYVGMLLIAFAHHKGGRSLYSSL
jgi:hypothetical protein